MEIDNDHIYGIDLIRFFCALSVAVYHLTWRARGVVWTLPFGWVGVEIFFVISGFVIANSAYSKSPGKFAISRFLRLYPGAWCALLVSTLFIAFAPPGTYVRAGVVASLTLGRFAGSVVLLAPDGVVSAYWTLPIELSFYIFITCLLFMKRFKNVQFWAIALILWTLPYCVVLILDAFAHRSYDIFHFGYGLGNTALLRHGSYFGLGMLVWAIKEKQATWIGFAGAALALASALGEIADRSRELKYTSTITVTNIEAKLTTIQLTSMSFIAFLAAVGGIVLSVQLNRKFPQGSAIRRSVKLLGLATYPFYLLHESVGGLAFDQMERVSKNELVNLAVALLAIGSISSLIARYFEPAVRRFLVRIGIRSTPVRATAP
jgi:exopolysaccharide production protein ExoZ